MRFSRSVTHLLVAALALVQAPANGAEKLAARIGASPFDHSGATATAGWIRRAQLVWVEEKATLERRAYELWRSEAETGLTFTWHPADIVSDQAGRISGAGRVVWRRVDAADYDPDGVVATYEGLLKEGLRHGQGVYSRRDGLVYDGDWRAGLMNGDGEISLPNGDHYTGEFVDGAPHGNGVYVDAEGVIFEGGFARGARDGDGVIRRPDDLIYKATWREGAELPGSRAQVAFPEVLYAALEDEFAVRVTVENLYAAGEHSYLGVRGGVSSHRTRAEGETLLIRPGAERILDVWKGSAPIHLVQDEEIGFGGTPGFLGIQPEDILPISLVFEFENRSREDAKIVSAYLDVAESLVDRAPMLHVSRGLDVGCMASRPDFDPTFQLQNFGWGRIETGEMTLQFTDESGRPALGAFGVDVGGLEGSRSISLARQLQTLGVDLQRLERGFDCSNAPYAQDRITKGELTPRLKQSCAAVLANSGAFGQLTPIIEVSDGRAMAHLDGRLDYSWRERGGRNMQRSAAFKTSLSLGEIVFSVPECGEGGAPEELADKPYRFRMDEENYRIRLGLRDTVPDGVSARWRIKLDADKNSRNLFRMVFNLSDGRRIASRPIDLMLIRPRFEP